MGLSYENLVGTPTSGAPLARALGSLPLAAGAGGLGALLASPMGLPLLLSFLPSLVARFQKDPRQEYMAAVRRLYSPENMSRLTSQYYQQGLASPGYSAAQGNIAAGANQMAGQLAQNLGARGLSTTGLGSVLSSMTPSVVGSQQAALNTQTYNAARSDALENIKQQLAAMGGGPYTTPREAAFSQSLQSFTPYLMNYLKGKYPKTFDIQQPQPVGVQHGQERVQR